MVNNAGVRTEPEILIEHHDLIAVVTLNRPRESNPIGWSLGKNLLEALEKLDADRDTRAIVLTGAGKNFCAGGQMGVTLGIHEIDVEEQYIAFRTMAKAVQRMRDMDLPVIGAINGAAVGGGAAVAISCDLSVISDNGYFGFSFGQLGASAADLGIPYQLPRLVGAMRARQILMTGSRVSATQAKEYGMVVDVVRSEQLIGAAVAIARGIVDNAPRAALAATKQVLKNAETADFGSTLYYEQFVQTYFLRSNEHRERLTAILEKKK